MLKIKKLLLLSFCTYSLTHCLTAWAGFLDMPDLTETPGVKRETMLRDVDIPPVSDRNPDPNAGPRLAVSEFKIQGLVEYPDLGITRESIHRLVDAIRFDMMAEGKLLESGYTLEELAEVSDLLIDIENETIDRHVTPIEVQKLVWLIREQRSKRGITLGQIETIADQITRFYRERGFILAKAYIPKQEVRDGIVNLTLLLGTLGVVEANGNEIYSDSTLTSVFDDMLTKPVTSQEVEENLYLINDFPGIVVDGYFEPGYQVGDTKLNINVKDETRYHANVRLDNHGTDETGLYRLYADFQVNNLIGIADSFHISALNASEPNNTLYWRINYQSNFFSPRWKFIADVSENQFVVDQTDPLLVALELNGVVTVYDMALRYMLKRSRTNNYFTEFKYEDITSDLQLGDLPDIGNKLDEKLNNYSLLFNYDILQESARRLHQGNVKLTTGSYEFGNDINQDQDYTYLFTDYTLLTFLKIPWVDANTRLIFRAAGQYAGKNISTILRMNMGGASRARAFPVSVFSADDGIYLGLDWVFNSPGFMDVDLGSVNLQRLIKPFVFVDYSYGLQHTLVAIESDLTGQLSDVGFGLQFNYRADLKGNLQFAFPISAKFSDPDIFTNDEDMRVVFDFQYSFF